MYNAPPCGEFTGDSLMLMMKTTAGKWESRDVRSRLIQLGRVLGQKSWQLANVPDAQHKCLILIIVHSVRSTSLVTVEFQYSFHLC